MEMVSTREEKIKSILAKSRWASSQNTTPISGTRESIFSQSISRYRRLITVSTAVPARNPGINRFLCLHFTGIRAAFGAGFSCLS